MNDTKQDEGVGIPDFLKRSEPKPADRATVGPLHRGPSARRKGELGAVVK